VPSWIGSRPSNAAPAGSNPAERTRAAAKRNGPSPPKAGFASSNLAGGSSSSSPRCPLVRTPGCLPGSGEFDPRRGDHARVSQPAEDAGPEPVCCRCKSCPWYHARVAQQQEAADSKPVQCWCNSSRAHRSTCIRVAKLATRTAVNRLIAGSNPAPGAGRVAQRQVQPLYKRPTRGSTPPAPTTVANPLLVGTSRRLMVISWVVQSGETAALKTAPVRVRIPPREHSSGGSPAKTRWL
jgi:hypothetical protein